MKSKFVFKKSLREVWEARLARNFHWKPVRLIALLAVIPVLTGGRCNVGTVVSLTASPTPIHQGETSNADATVTTGPPGNTPVVSHRVNFTLDVTTAGSLNAARATTSNQGVARAIFTAGAVNVDTPVNVTATSTNLAGTNDTKTIVVRPPIIFGDFGGDPPGISVTNADIVIRPSVVKLDTFKYRFTYVLTTPGTATMDRLSLTFAVPMYSVTSSAPTLTILNGGQLNTVNFTLAATTVTITAECDDCDTGGLAEFTIFNRPAPSPPGSGPPALVFDKTVIGPKPPP